MNTFIQKYDPNINGVLSGSDRLVTNNTFAGNGKNGIGGLGGGGDTFNVVSGNTCCKNGRHGIEIENGSGNVVTANICYDNSASEPGSYAGITPQKPPSPATSHAATSPAGSSSSAQTPSRRTTSFARRLRRRNEV